MGTKAAPSRPSDLVPFALDHLGVFAPLFIATVVAGRLWAVGGWDVITARAVLQESGAANVLVGTGVAALVWLLKSAAAFFFVAAVFRLANRGMRGFDQYIGSGLLAGALLVFFASFANFLIWLAVALIAAFFGWSLRGEDESSAAVDADAPSSPWDRALPWISVVLAAFASTYLISTEPWLPVQVVGPEDDRQVGYVLSEDSEKVAFLLDEPRMVIYIPGEKIDERFICDKTASRFARSLPELLGLRDAPGDKYPDCPPTE